MEQEPVHTEKLDPFTIEIVPDYDCQNPVEDYDWEGMALCLAFGRKGELKTLNMKGIAPQSLLSLVKPETEDEADSKYFGWHIFPVYAYIHSGITINLGGFSCPWDSGCCGYVAIDPKQYPDKEQAYKCAESLIKTSDDYLTGNVYGWIVKDSDDGIVESVWGYMGDYEKSGCLDEARNCAKHLIAPAEHHTEAQAID